MLNTHGLNTLCHQCRHNAINLHVMCDNYGKALSAAVLGFEIDVPDGLIGKLHGNQ